MKIAISCLAFLVPVFVVGLAAYQQATFCWRILLTLGVACLSYAVFWRTRYHLFLSDLF
jgi:hypothetical protein